MGYKHIVFDIDGTLIDTDYATVRSLQKLICELAGRCLGVDELQFAIGITSHDAVIHLGMQNVDDAVALWDSYYESLNKFSTVYGDIENGIQYLSRQNITLGIVTSRSRDEYRKDYILDPLKPFFDIVICREDSRKHKPNPEPLLSYLEKAKVAPQGVLYVGDTVYDMMCASAAGVDFAYAQWNRRNQEIHGVKYSLESMRDLIKLVMS